MDFKHLQKCSINSFIIGLHTDWQSTEIRHNSSYCTQPIFILYLHWTWESRSSDHILTHRYCSIIQEFTGVETMHDTIDTRTRLKGSSYVAWASWLNSIWALLICTDKDRFGTQQDSTNEDKPTSYITWFDSVHSAKRASNIVITNSQNCIYVYIHTHTLAYTLTILTASLDFYFMLN